MKIFEGRSERFGWMTALGIFLVICVLILSYLYRYNIKSDNSNFNQETFSMKGESISETEKGVNDTVNNKIPTSSANLDPSWSSSSLSVHNDLSSQSQYETSKTQTSEQCYDTLGSYGEMKLVCPDAESEIKYYFEMCISFYHQYRYKDDPTILDDRYIVLQKEYYNKSSPEHEAQPSKWWLIEDCLINEGQKLFGLYNVDTKEIIYFYDYLNTKPSQRKEMEFSINLISERKGNKVDYPIIFIGIGSRGSVVEAIDTSVLETKPFGNFAKTTKLFDRDDFKDIGTVLFLDKGIIVATEKGVAKYNYKQDTFDVIIPTEPYELFGPESGHTLEAFDTLDYLGSNSFTYQLYDEEGNPKGERITYTLK